MDLQKSQELREEEADEVWSLAYDVMSEFNDEGVDRLLSVASSTASGGRRISPTRLHNKLRQIVDLSLKAEAEGGESPEKRGVNDRLMRHLLARIEDEGDTLSTLQNEQRTHYSLAKMKNYLKEKAAEMRRKQKEAEA